MNRTIGERYKSIRKHFETQFAEQVGYFDLVIKHIDDFIKSDDATDLEKEFYLLLSQFPGDIKPYAVKTPNIAPDAPTIGTLLIPDARPVINI